ncbi:MAG TPA: hypothetical protein VMN76_10665, partial [Acidobacteriota bacterium]|nr:hypothetical protein [Acidobacteriota bacterium]
IPQGFDLTTAPRRSILKPANEIDLTPIMEIQHGAKLQLLLDAGPDSFVVVAGHEYQSGGPVA